MVLEIAGCDNLVNVVVVGMKMVVRQLVVHPQKDQNATRHSNGQTQQITACKSLMPKEISPGYFKIVPKHVR
jgi:hypothetical protein